MQQTYHTVEYTTVLLVGIAEEKGQRTPLFLHSQFLIKTHMLLHFLPVSTHLLILCCFSHVTHIYFRLPLRPLVQSRTQEEVWNKNI